MRRNTTVSSMSINVIYLLKTQETCVTGDTIVDREWCQSMVCRFTIGSVFVFIMYKMQELVNKIAVYGLKKKSDLRAKD